MFIGSKWDDCNIWEIWHQTFAVGWFIFSEGYGYIFARVHHPLLVVFEVNKIIFFKMYEANHPSDQITIHSFALKSTFHELYSDWIIKFVLCPAKNQMITTISDLSASMTIYHHLSPQNSPGIPVLFPVVRSQGPHRWCWAAQSRQCWPQDAPRYRRWGDLGDVGTQVVIEKTSKNIKKKHRLVDNGE